jgi:hypothetical protein
MRGEMEGKTSPLLEKTVGESSGTLFGYLFERTPGEAV